MISLFTQINVEGVLIIMAETAILTIFLGQFFDLHLQED